MSNINIRGGFLSLAAFVASAVFFGLAVFGATMGDTNLVEAGLFSLSLGFVLERLGT